MKKALLLQLPNYSLPFAWPRENVPLALGYLATMARKEGPRDVEVELLEPHLADSLGDQALLEAVLERDPDVLGLTLYCWNVERAILLATRARERRPGLVVVVGGPEVTYDNRWIWDTPAFDVGVVGEGERAFNEILATVAAGRRDFESIQGLVLPPPKPGGPLRPTGPRDPILALDEVPSPYLEGILTPDRAGFICFETIRGCAYRCAFCYYYKDYEKTQGYSAERIAQLFDYARSSGVREAFLLDPTLNQRKDFTGFLRSLAAANPGGRIELHSELRAEFVSDEQAAILYEAGMRGVEVGLQSINKDTLREIHRHTHLDKFTRGVKTMEAAGLEVRLDLILGLPGDTIDDVRKAVGFVLGQGFRSTLQVFNLQALPGTELRQRAEEVGLVFLPRPPYTVLSTRQMSAADLAEAHAYCSEAFDVSFDPDPPPVLHEAADANGSPYLSRAVLDLAADGAPDEAALAASGEEFARRAANALTVAVRTRDLGRDLARVRAFLAPVTNANPYAPIDLVVEARGPAEVRVEDLARLRQAAASPDHYLCRYRREAIEEGAIPSARVTVVAEPANAGAAWLAGLEEVVPVYREVELDGTERASALREVACEGGLVVRARPGADARKLVAKLARFADDDPGAVCLRDPALAAAYDEAVGKDGSATVDDRVWTGCTARPLR